jgi:hypothetical protein
MAFSRFVSCASAFAIVTWVATASAENATRGAKLTWVRGASADRCVGALGLEEDVKARLGYDPFVAGESGAGRSAPVIIEGAVTRQATGFRAELVVRDKRGAVLGTRVLSSRDQDCRSLGEAVAVAITVTIDPDVAGTRPPEVEESTQPGPETAPVIASAPKLPTERQERGRATLAFGGSAGLLPGIASVVSLRVSRNVGAAWELRGGAHFWPETVRSGVGLALATGALDACVLPLSSVRALRWCAGIHLGAFQVFVHSPDLVPVDVGMFLWGAAETGPGLSLTLVGPLRLDASVAALVPMTRRQALVLGLPGAVWEQSAIAGRADVGLSANF